MSIIIFLIVLAVLILVHEFGHFIVAKKFGVRVDEFGLGFPPKLFGFKKGETEYTLNAIPFGGFVKIFGETSDDESLAGPDSDRSLLHKPKLVQAAIIFAGVFFNLLLAWLLISIGFVSGLPTPVNGAPRGAEIENVHLTVISVNEGSPAYMAGLIPGDQILALSREESFLGEPTIETIQAFINDSGGDEIELVYKRGSVTESVFIAPTEDILEDRFAVGIGMDMIGTVSLPVYRAVWEGAKMTIGLTVAVVAAFWGLIAGIFSGGADLSSIAGPIGIVGIVGDAADFGFVYLIGLVAFISINLAVINLLPFPALDGGRLLFLLIETIKRSPINPRIANTANAIGFALLILLMIIVTFNDILRII